jgi:hypothetical protein
LKAEAVVRTGTIRRHPPAWEDLRATKPFSHRDETSLKQGFARMALIKQRGAIMLAVIINLFYRQSCRAALSAIRRQNQIWA